MQRAFSTLNRALECANEDIVWVSYLITAIFILYNFLIDEHDDTPIDAVDDHDTVYDGSNDLVNGGDSDLTGENKENTGGLPTCNILLRHMYWLNHSSR
jgi:hypothetical protein